MIPTRNTPHLPKDNNNNIKTEPLPPTPLFKPLLRNFRKAAGLSNIYRCASTDVLGTLFPDQQQQQQQQQHQHCEPTTHSSSSSIDVRHLPPPPSSSSSPETIVLNHIGLVLDLRSSRERNEDLVRRWTSHAHGGPFRVVAALDCCDGTAFGDGCEPKNGGFLEGLKTNDDICKDSVESNNDGNMHPGSKPNKGNQYQRTVLHIDILNRKRLVRWYEKQIRTIPENNGDDTNDNPSPLTRPQSTQLTNTIHRLGLMGLYRCILDTSGEEIRRALVALTEYLEWLSQQQRTGVGVGDGVVVHCVQGKDRTGLVIMLCQSIMGVEDSVIVEDYHKSDGMEVSPTTTKKLTTGAVSVMAAAAAATKTKTTKIKTTTTKHNSIHNNSWKPNRELSSAAPRETMVRTLAYLRETYGSVENYLDSIVGFDGAWRNRFVNVQKLLLGGEEGRDKEVVPLGLLPVSRF